MRAEIQVLGVRMFESNRLFSMLLKDTFGGGVEVFEGVCVISLLRLIENG